jgi:flagellum-specific peptidoglycan hydrolase FlgJ
MPSAKVTTFLNMLRESAQASMKETGIPASFTLAQGALESNWGTSELCRMAMNIFGVKADKSWTGLTYSIQTREFLKGQWVSVPAVWRRYSNYLACLNDHAKFFQDNPRYKDCFKETTGEGWALAVAKAGYATDPDYAQKLIATIKANNLTIFDVVPSSVIPMNVQHVAQDPSLPPPPTA